jgi:glycine cleavage system H protein
MNIPSNLKYTKTDEWFDPGTGAMGLSDYAQSQLSDIVFLEVLVDVGDMLEAGTAIASVESVKASAEIYASAGGKVTAVNKALSEA